MFTKIFLALFLQQFIFNVIDCFNDNRAFNFYEISNNLVNNLTVNLNKQIRLPCLVERDRKFIWMNSKRAQIISIDRSIIIDDKRFSLDLSNANCYTSTSKLNIQGRHVLSNRTTDLILPKKEFCLTYLVIDEAKMDDEGLYICQIDTMTSFKLQLNVLVSPFLKRVNYFISQPSNVVHYHNFDPKQFVMEMDEEESSGINNIYDYESQSSRFQPKRTMRKKLKDSSSSSSSSMDSMSINLIEGSDIQLVCEVNGKPTPSIRWFIREENQTNSNLLIGTNSMLLLRNFTRNFKRNYECVGENGVSPSLSRLFTINVLCKCFDWNQKSNISS